MDVSREYGRKLIREGKAVETGLVPDELNEDCLWVAIERRDMVRVDHFPATGEDVIRLRAKLNT